MSWFRISARPLYYKPVSFCFLTTFSVSVGPHDSTSREAAVVNSPVRERGVREASRA